jgi:hypothetical protein
MRRLAGNDDTLGERGSLGDPQHPGRRHDLEPARRHHPNTCTVTSDKIPNRLELVERLRRDLCAVERTIAVLVS